jgi:hypothetical protein
VADWVLLGSEPSCLQSLILSKLSAKSAEGWQLTENPSRGISDTRESCIVDIGVLLAVYFLGHCSSAEIPMQISSVR